MSNQFSIKDLREATYILGIRIYRDRSRGLLGLSQSTYIDKILKWFGMDLSKRGNIPMLHGKHLLKSKCPKTQEERDNMSRIPYASAIGSIMYSMLCTRSDVSFSLSIASRFQSNYGEEYWTAVKNILKYLRRPKDMFLIYGDRSRGLLGLSQSTYIDKILKRFSMDLFKRGNIPMMHGKHTQGE